MSEFIIYEKPTCTKCRETRKLIEESGNSYKEIDYYEEPLTHEKLKELLDKMALSPKEVLRKNEKIYRELDLKNKDVSDDELIDLMIKYPDLMQRPIVEKDNKAILGRPPENVKQLF